MEIAGLAILGFGLTVAGVLTVFALYEWWLRRDLGARGFTRLGAGPAVFVTPGRGSSYVGTYTADHQGQRVTIRVIRTGRALQVSVVEQTGASCP